MSRLSIAPSFALLAVLPFAACGGDESGGEMPVIETPETPTKTVETAVDALRSQELGKVWQLLPDTYQKDVSKLLSAASKKIDAEVYAKSMKTASSVVALLRDKKGMILELAKENMGPMAEQQDLGATIDGVVKMLGAITDSKHLATTEALGSMDVGQFLHETGKSIMPAAIDMAKMSSDGDAEQMLAFFNGTKKFEIKEKSADAKHAVLELSFDGKTEEVHMAKVGDHWLPEEMADDWSKTITEAMKSIEQMPAMDAQQKAQADQMIGMIDQLVGQLSEAESGEEMMEMLMRNPLFNMAQGMMGGR